MILLLLLYLAHADDTYTYIDTAPASDSRACSVDDISVAKGCLIHPGHVIDGLCVFQVVCR